MIQRRGSKIIVTKGKQQEREENLKIKGGSIQRNRNHDSYVLMSLITGMTPTNNIKNSIMKKEEKSQLQLQQQQQQPITEFKGASQLQRERDSSKILKSYKLMELISNR